MRRAGLCRALLPLVFDKDLRMSYDPNAGFPPPPKKSGGCMKVVLGIGCLGIVLGAICCGGVVYFSKQWFQFSQDSVVAAAAGKAIADVPFLDGYKAEGSMGLSIPFMGPMMSLAFYTNADAGATFMLGEFNATFAQGKGAEDFQREFRQGFNKDQKQDDFKATKTTDRDVTVRGKPNPFKFTEGKYTAHDPNGVDAWQVSGSFEGKTGPAFLMWTVPKSEYATIDELVEDLETIK